MILSNRTESEFCLHKTLWTPIDTQSSASKSQSEALGSYECKKYPLPISIPTAAAGRACSLEAPRPLRARRWRCTRRIIVKHMRQ
jgi:hypothetical protein